MKLPHVLLLALILMASAEAQETPPDPPSPPSAPQPAPATPTPPPAEVVQPAIPVNPTAPAAAPAPVPTELSSGKPATFTQEEVLQRETNLKKQMMLVGMASGVVGLLLGMMIGRKTAPRPTGRRY